jgi:hypothetical protein
MDHPISLPAELLQYIVVSTDVKNTTTWRQRFRKGQRQFFEPDQWRMLLYAMGRRLFMGEAAYLQDIEQKQNSTDETDRVVALYSWKVLRCFRETLDTFKAWIFNNNPFLKNHYAWSCFSFALSAVRLHRESTKSTESLWTNFQRVIDAHQQAHPRCVFTHSSDKDELSLIHFSYVFKHPVTKIQEPATSPSYIIHNDMLPMIYSLMAVGQIDAFLNQYLFEAILVHKNNNEEQRAMDLLANIDQTHTTIRDIIFMLDHATYYLWLFLKEFTPLKMGEFALSRPASVESGDPV